MNAVARWCFQRRYLVLAMWVVALVALSVLGSAAKPRYDSSFSVPGSDSAQALSLLQQSLPAQAGEQDTLVWHTSTGSIRDAAVARKMAGVLATIATLPEVAAVLSPYAADRSAQISLDGTTAYAVVTFTDEANNLKAADVNKVIDTARAAGTGTLQVDMTGQATDQANQPKLGPTVLVALVAAALVLFVAFGSLLGMLLPLIAAIFGLGTGLMAVGLLSHGMGVAALAPNLSVLIGLGVGIDYALFIVTRYRRGLTAGLDPAEASAAALNTSGRAVLFAGATVCVALLGMLVLGIGYLNGVAVAAALVVLFTVATATTLLPALFGIFGRRVLSRRQRRRLAETGPGNATATGFWLRWAGTVQARPRLLALVALVVMVTLALPVFSMRLGHAGDNTLPTSMTSRRGYDLLSQGFGAGFNGPLQVVAKLGSTSDSDALGKLVDAARRTEGVAAVTGPTLPPVTPGSSSRIALVTVYPASAPDARQTADVLHRLRDQVVPAATAGSGLEAHVGGAAAVFDDFATMLKDALPLFITVIVGLGALLLLVAFRSLAVPLTAAVMNLLGAGASFGVVVVIFQWGWGLSVMGLGDTGPVESFMPVLMLAVLFGLSMDYQVFLLSRTHEEWVHGRDNARAVRTGIAETGRVITAAAGIMLCVFLAFALGGQRVIAEFGLSLVAAVALDAFIIRSVLNPAVMFLLGRANWWLPRWLDRVLPHLSVEPPERAPEPEPAAPAAQAALLP
jgi:putative drug exporter of the RND superfamily